MAKVTHGDRDMRNRSKPASHLIVKKMMLKVFRGLHVPGGVHIDIVGEGEWILTHTASGLFIDTLEPYVEETIAGDTIFWGYRVGFVSVRGGHGYPDEQEDVTLKIFRRPEYAVSFLVGEWTKHEADQLLGLYTG